MSKAEKHPHFDLWLHSTESLADAIGHPINHRETIHDWPLSTVQKISCGDGTIVIYKSQTQATVEPEFYSVAHSSLLPAHQYLGEINGCHTMVFEYIHGSRVSELSLDDSQILALGQRIESEIAGIQGALPTYIDIGSEKKWLAFAESTINAISALIDNQIFTTISHAALSSLREWIKMPFILDLVETTSVLTHGDLNGENIFMVGKELRLIDWQRPQVAPKAIDTIALLYGKGVDPSRYVNQETVKLFHFLKICWFVECQTLHFPEGSTYEQSILHDLSKVLAAK